MFNRIARFVVRPSDETMQNGDLILGCMFKNQTGILKPNHVYELHDVMSVPTVIHVGESAMGMYPANCSIPNKQLKGLFHNVSWSNELSWIVDVGRGSHLLTRKEIGD